MRVGGQTYNDISHCSLKLKMSSVHTQQGMPPRVAKHQHSKISQKGKAGGMYTTRLNKLTHARSSSAAVLFKNITTTPKQTQLQHPKTSKTSTGGEPNSHSTRDEKRHGTANPPNQTDRVYSKLAPPAWMPRDP